jgi:hypothetical protein
MKHEINDSWKLTKSYTTKNYFAVLIKDEPEKIVLRNFWYRTRILYN